MTEGQQILDPRNAGFRIAQSIAPRPVSLPSTLGILDVGSAASSHFAESLLVQLLGANSQTALQRYRKPWSGRPTSPALRHQIAAEVEVLITALPQDGAAAVSTALDAMWFEGRRVPTILIAPTRLASVTTATASAMGFVDLQCVFIPHGARPPRSDDVDFEGLVEILLAMIGSGSPAPADLAAPPDQPAEPDTEAHPPEPAPDRNGNTSAARLGNLFAQGRTR